MATTPAITSLIIRNVNSGCVWWAQLNDKDKYLTEGNYPYNPAPEEYFVEKTTTDGVYRIRNYSTEEYVHGDKNGTSWIRLDGTINNDNCQKVRFERHYEDGRPTHKWKIVNAGNGYFVHGDKEGTGSLRFEAKPNDICQLFVFYRGPIDPTAT